MWGEDADRPDEVDAKKVRGGVRGRRWYVGERADWEESECSSDSIVMVWAVGGPSRTSFSFIPLPHPPLRSRTRSRSWRGTSCILAFARLLARCSPSLTSKSPPFHPPLRSRTRSRSWRSATCLEVSASSVTHYSFLLYQLSSLPPLRSRTPFRSWRTASCFFTLPSFVACC